MPSTFPFGVGMSHVRGLIKIIRENGGSISISGLAEESEEDVDDLIPLIEACKLLGFVVVAKSDIKLTPKGTKISTPGVSSRAIIRESLPRIEPFKSTIKALSAGGRNTEELLAYLQSKKVLPESSEISEQMLLDMLLTWGVRSRLLSYDQESNRWILVA